MLSDCIVAAVWSVMLAIFDIAATSRGLLLRVTGDLDRLEAGLRGLRDGGVVVERVPAHDGVAAGSGATR